MRDINGIYVIKDDVAQVFATRSLLIMYPTHAEAERAFRGSFLRGDLPEVSENPGDYHLYCVGTYNVTTGELTPRTPELVANFIAYVKKEKEDE